MHFDMSFLWPLVKVAVTSAVGAAVMQAWRWAGNAASSIHDQNVRQWVQTLILAAESSATAPETGPQKKEWVTARMQALFPRLSPGIISDLVEAILQGTARAAASSG